ncbi:MAG: hypothetical protein F4X77_02410 [Acidobacteriia bacterium]|nr:hypothetical protein [Terriglobia bacterium]
MVLTEENTKRGKLLQQYVTARITRMDRINIGLFDYDRYNTLYFFVLNADEQIYLRYGGRDVRSATTYLDLESLELALEHGLELHRQYRSGKLAKRPAPPPKYPRDIPALVERTVARGRCVECHLIGDLENVQRELDGTLDKLRDLHRAPDIRKLGIELDVPKGLRIASAAGAAVASGMRSGDVIRKLNGVDVWTFGDFQWEYGRVHHTATQLAIVVERHGSLVDLNVQLPRFWWHTDLTYRNLSVDPRVYFRSKPLALEEKRTLGLDEVGFASRVVSIDSLSDILESHQLQIGDVIYGVDGVTRDEVANSAELHIKLRRLAGSELSLQVLRRGERIEMPLKTTRMSFRK